MSGKYLLHIANKVINRPLMILPEKLGLISSVLDGRIGIDASELSSAVGQFERPEVEGSQFVGSVEKDADGKRKAYRTTADGVAIIPVMGSLVNRYDFFDAVSGTTSYEKLKHTLALAAADPDVSSILLDIDSPGGEAIGAFEAADAVRAAAAIKPVVSVVNGMAASAAYAIASASTTIITTPSGLSGSIGVVMMHADYSHKLHDAGVKPTLIHAGARKVDGNPYQPLTDDVRAELKGEIDRFYSLFVDTVAKGRKGLNAAKIRATEARTYIGADAVKIGLADRVGSFETALADLGAKSGARPKPVPQRMDVSAPAPGASEEIAARILALPEARDRAAAAKILSTAGVTVEDAKSILLAFPKDPKPLSERASSIAISPVEPVATRPNAPKQAGAVPWDEIVAIVAPKVGAAR